MAKESLGVAMIGYSFMGRAHARAWREVSRFFDLARTPELRVLAGRDPAGVQAAAPTLGFADTTVDWRSLLHRDDIDVIDICTPGDSHAEIAIAALDAGKHVLCEKPLANTVDEAEAMAAAASAAAARGVRAMVGFNYRRIPATRLARDMIAAGRLGEIRHVRARYLQDFIVDPNFPLIWRLQKEKAGSGALGDLGAHVIDLAQFMTSDSITGVTALTETFIKERPIVDGGATGGLDAVGGADRGTVTVDDAALFLARFGSGAIGTFEATRFATGRKNALHIEINGSKGSIVFDLESLNELWYYDASDEASTAGFRRVLVTEGDHPYVHAWWPPGHVLGWEHSFVHEIYDFVRAIDADDQDLHPSFQDGLQTQYVLHAVETSALNGSSWRAVPSS